MLFILLGRTECSASITGKMLGLGGLLHFGYAASNVEGHQMVA